MDTARQPEAAVLDDGATPIGVLAERLNRSVRTLKRWYARGWLPVLFLAGQWAIPNSFLTMLFTAPRPAQGATLQEVAAKWFAERQEA